VGQATVMSVDCLMDQCSWTNISSFFHLSYCQRIFKVTYSVMLAQMSSATTLYMNLVSRPQPGLDIMD